MSAGHKGAIIILIKNDKEFTFMLNEISFFNWGYIMLKYLKKLNPKLLLELL